MRLIRTIVPFSVLCLFLACKNGNTQNSAVLPAPKPTYAAPPISVALPETELKHYNAACNSFFDSLLLDRGSFNGSILVAKNGSVVYEKYAGFADPLRKRDSLTPSNAFHLASVSKTFTAMAVLKLWEQARLSLEDTLGKFFPNFPYRGITVKMLLSHRSGLPNYVHYLELNGWDKRKLVNNVDVLTSLYMMHIPLEFPSGKHFSYCNTNYALLALIIEKVSGQFYREYLQQTFFTPLQMKDTYVWTLKDTARAMHSFEWNKREFRLDFLDGVCGDKNIYSTVRDMLKWDQALYAGQIFKQTTLDSAFSGYSFEKEGKRNYGLGWRMTFLDNGKKLLYHNGWWHGNNSVFIRLVDEKATIIVLGNRFNRKIYSAKKLSDLFGDYKQTKNGIDEGEGGTGGGEPKTRHKSHSHRRHHRPHHKSHS